MYNEAELVARSRDGDINAFEELVSCYERKIYTVTYRLMGNHDDANDLAQEAFLRAFTAIKNFRGEASFLTWMCRIATNVCRDELRKKHRVSMESLDERITLDDGEVDNRCLTGPAPLKNMRKNAGRIQKLINTLPGRLALFVISGVIHEEIAKSWNVRSNSKVTYKQSPDI